MGRRRQPCRQVPRCLTHDTRHMTDSQERLAPPSLCAVDRRTRQLRDSGQPVRDDTPKRETRGSHVSNRVYACSQQGSCYILSGSCSSEAATQVMFPETWDGGPFPGEGLGSPKPEGPRGDSPGLSWSTAGQDAWA